MVSFTVVAPPIFICLVSIGSPSLAFAASEDHVSDAGECQVAPVAAATGASLLQNRKHVSLERTLATGASHGGVQTHLPIVNSPLASGAGHGGVQKGLPIVDSPIAVGAGLGGVQKGLPIVDSPLAVGAGHGGVQKGLPIVDSPLAAGAGQSDVLKGVPIVNSPLAVGAGGVQNGRPNVRAPLAVGAGHGGVHKGLPLVERSAAAGRTGPTAKPSSARPNLAGRQTFQAPSSSQTQESLAFAKQSSGSAQNAHAAAVQFPGLVGTLARAVMPMSLMLVISSVVLALLHRFAAAERTEDVVQQVQQNEQKAINRTLQYIDPAETPQSTESVEQGDAQKSATQTTSLSLSYSSGTSLTTAEPASSESPSSKTAKSADEAAGSAAASSEHVIARVLGSMEEGDTSLFFLRQQSGRLSER